MDLAESAATLREAYKEYIINEKAKQAKVEEAMLRDSSILVRGVVITRLYQDVNDLEEFTRKLKTTSQALIELMGKDEQLRGEDSEENLKALCVSFFDALSGIGGIAAGTMEFLDRGIFDGKLSEQFAQEYKVSEEKKEGVNRKGVEAAAKASQMASWYLWKAYGILRPHTEFVDFHFTCSLNDKAMESMKTWPEFKDKKPQRISWDYASPEGIPVPDTTSTNQETTTPMEDQEMEPKKVGLSAPWNMYVRQVKALFGKDPDIKIEYDEDSMTLTLYVSGAVKADAIQHLLPYERRWGNTKLKIFVAPGNSDKSNPDTLFNAAFSGNPVFVKAEGVRPEGCSNAFTYVTFANEVVQMWNDNIGDPNGLTSDLLQNIAPEVFAPAFMNGVMFSTAKGDDVIR
jgi:hypothetical protein